MQSEQATRVSILIELAEQRVEPVVLDVENHQIGQVAEAAE